MTPEHPCFYLAIKAAFEASKAIMQIYQNNFETEFKQDGSPITIADRTSNEIIINNLQPTGFGFISEESPLEIPSVRKQHEYTWIIDPIDGTKEFIHRNGEFTVNIALVQNHRLRFGVVTAPALNTAWFGWEGYGAFKIDNMDVLNLESTHKTISDIINASVPIRVRPVGNDPVFAVSRSHLTQNTLQMIQTIFGNFEDLKTLQVGSSLKFCMVAEGKADYYLRADAINEWDTGAGHAVLIAAGGRLLAWPQNFPILYNKDLLINPGFVAIADNQSINGILAKFPSKEGV